MYTLLLYILLVESILPDEAYAVVCVVRAVMSMFEGDVIQAFVAVMELPLAQ